MLKTPRKMPAGESVSRSSGGNDAGVKSAGGRMGNEVYAPRNVGGGSVE